MVRVGKTARIGFLTYALSTYVLKEGETEGGESTKGSGLDGVRFVVCNGTFVPVVGSLETCSFLGGAPEWDSSGFISIQWDS